MLPSRLFVPCYKECIHVLERRQNMRAKGFVCGMLVLALVAGGCKKKDRGLTTDLHRVAEAGNLQKVQVLIAKGAAVNARDSQGRTPLHLAAARGHREVAEVLVRCGAHVDSRSVDGATSAELAALADHKEIVECLIGAGATVTLRIAAYLGDAAKVGSLVEEGAAANAGRQRDGMPLCLAVREGHIEVVRLLLAKGADVNSMDSDQETALHVALRKNRVDVAELLISSGGDVNAILRTGDTPLSYAAEHGLIDMTRLLIAKGAAVSFQGVKALCKAAAEGHQEVVQLLLASGVNVNLADKYGRTALHEAVSAGQREVVELLLVKGADVNRIWIGSEYPDGDYTPLHIAAANGNREVVELLLAKGANVNAEARWGDRPLHDLLGRYGYENVWELIGYLGVNIKGKSEDPYELVRAPDREHRMEVLDLLLVHGADVNLVGGNGWTALHAAASYGCTRAV
jgi:ankyrin repeat protein